MEIITIPSNKDNDNSNSNNKPAKLKVAAYARVSMDKEAAFHSFEAQKAYYEGYIKNHPEWELADIYSDNGISGTVVERPEFTRLLEDCKKKDNDGRRKIDFIITKSISRFARNIVTLLSAIRELKALGIDVYFEKEDFHSISPDGEMMITFIAMYAEEEARSASENMKWRIKKRFENGEPWVGKMLGYRLKDRKLVIVEEEARIVREVFALYLSGWGRLGIAKYLQEKYQPVANISLWSRSGILRILTNEKYKGDMLLQKKYRPDFMTKKSIEVKHGEVTQYYVASSHEPIIPPAVFDKVQEEIKRRSNNIKRIIQASSASKNRAKDPKKNPELISSDQNPFKGLIVCNKCNHKCIYRCHRSGGYLREIMICHHHYYYGNALCTNKAIPLNVLLKETSKVLHLKLDEELMSEEQMIEQIKEIIKRKIKQIRLDDKKLFYILTDGRTITKKWGLISRSRSWTPEMRERARQRTIAYYRTKQEPTSISA